MEKSQASTFLLLVQSSQRQGKDSIAVDGWCKLEDNRRHGEIAPVSAGHVRNPSFLQQKLQNSSGTTESPLGDATPRSLFSRSRRFVGSQLTDRVLNRYTWIDGTFSSTAEESKQNVEKSSLSKSSHRNPGAAQSTSVPGTSNATRSKRRLVARGDANAVDLASSEQRLTSDTVLNTAATILRRPQCDDSSSTSSPTDMRSDASATAMPRPRSASPTSRRGVSANGAGGSSRGKVNGEVEQGEEEGEAEGLPTVEDLEKMLAVLTPPPQRRARREVDSPDVLPSVEEIRAMLAKTPRPTPGLDTRDREVSLPSEDELDMAISEYGRQKEALRQQHEQAEHALPDVPPFRYRELTEAEASLDEDRKMPLEITARLLELDFERLDGLDEERVGCHNDGYDDRDNDYIVHRGEVMGNGLVVERRLGKGSYGQVVRAYDRVTGERVAIKIVKNSRAYARAAHVESRALTVLNQLDPSDKHATVRLLDEFVFRNHQCLVFELLSFSLYDVLRCTSFYGLPLHLVRSISHDMLRCLVLLEDADIVHCDLKPENILLRHPQLTETKVADFGSSINQSLMSRQSLTERSYIQSRFYRAPEVMLGGANHTAAIDMWSFACILVELLTGLPLFRGRDEVDQMGKICEVLGLPPRDLLGSSGRAEHFFELSDDEVALKQSPDGHRTPVPASRSLRHVIAGAGGLSDSSFGLDFKLPDSPDVTPADYEHLQDLAHNLLQYHPDRRLTPRQAIEHPFFAPLAHR